jgi:hypothetical protein
LSRWQRPWLAWLLVMCAPIVHADETNNPASKPAPSAASTPKPATAKPAPASADDELLEFLGSVGEDADGDWIDYLSKTDISKVSRAKEKAPAATGVTAK